MSRTLDFGQFDFGQCDFGQLAEIELAGKKGVTIIKKFNNHNKNCDCKSRCLSAPGCCIARSTQTCLCRVVVYRSLCRGSCCGPPTAFPVLAPVFRGSPCRDPPVYHRVQGDSVAKRQGLVVCLLEYLHSCSTGSAVQALSRRHSHSFVSLPPNFLRVVGALSNSSSCSTRSSSRSRSRRHFLACCWQCRNPSCSRKCKSVPFSVD